MNIEVGGKNDPIANFGREVSDYVMQTIQAVPAGQRKAALRAVFDQIDPKLWTRVANKASAMQRQHGLSAKDAMQRAMAASMSMGLLEEFIRAGKTGVVKPNSMLGLAAYGSEALGSLKWYDPVSWVTGGKANLKWSPESYGSAAKAVGSWGKSVLDKVGDAACSVASSNLGKVAAGAGSAAAGVPPQVGMQGASLVSGVCTPQQQIVVQQKASSGFPWIPVLAIGGAAVILILVLK